MKIKRNLLILSLFVIIVLSFTACSDDDSSNLDPQQDGRLKVNLKQQSSIAAQAVDEKIEDKITITEVELKIYKKSDYDSNGTDAEVVESKTEPGESSNDIGTIAFYLPPSQNYVIEAVLSGDVSNNEGTNSVTGIYQGVLDSTGVLEEQASKSVTVDVTPRPAEELDVTINGIPSTVGDTAVDSMDVELSIPKTGDVIKTISSEDLNTDGGTVTFTNDDLTLTSASAQIDVQLNDSSGNSIEKENAGEFGGEILLLPKQSQSLTVNQQPYLEVADQTVDEDSELQFTVNAEDPDGDSLTELSISNKPSGASFDPNSDNSSGTFTWTPTYEQSGSYDVTFAVESSNGGVNSETITITVNNVNRVPSIDSITNVSSGSATITEGKELSLAVNATDEDGDSISYSISGSDANKFSQSGNTFTWTPPIDDYSSDNTFNVTLEVSDGTDTTTKDVTITVDDDTTAPEVGSSGTITTSNETVSSVDLSWTKATDNISSQANLEYLVYYSTSNNINTVADCENNGTAFGSYNADINTKTVTNLLAETTYYFNVVVKDIVGNKSVYTANTKTTKPLDSEAPILGDGGTINTSDVQANSVTLDWTKASDDLSSDENVEYKVVYSTANNISTVEDIESNNGTIAKNWTTNINNITVTGLDVNVEYYFNVVVKDEAQNKAVYNMTSAQTKKSWNLVGNEVTSNESFDIDMAFNSEDIPYVVYYIEGVDRFGNDIREVKVKKFEDGSWQIVGSSGFVQDVRYLSIEIGSDDIPYVGYSHFGNADSNIVGVYKFENNSWQRLEGLNFGGNIKEFGMALDSNNHPCIAYARFYWENSSYLQDTEVWKHDGNRWSKIGDSLIDGVEGYDGQYDNILDITFDSTDTPYVFSWDTNEESYVVKKFDSTWQQVGDNINSSSDFSIKIDSVDTAYISYIISGGYDGDNEAVVKKYSGGSWQEVSSPSSSDVSGLDLSFDSENILYVFYHNNTESNVEVKKFVDNSWQLLGKSIEGWDGDLAIGFNSNDVPYIFYENDSYSSGERSYQSMVRKFE
ncbi:fibronectin type III domain-containing protein [Halanaerobacter jeridensis]|uniref:Fibronectin type III domain-containing protein n=1 Tax=Halanaerobacter jeridensis TaxID=706427 RepID=A0A939BMP5_9FIRM|nr:fibronectin type III domain-containing protein [Halanaerobacter jeridensis]MBM7557075.1 hypothetical protein [Halanaerobacter jeridensis]